MRRSFPISLVVFLLVVSLAAGLERPDTARELKQLQELHQKEAAAALEPVTKRYTAALEQLLFTPNAGLAPHTERFRWSNLGLEYRAVLDAVAGVAAPRAAMPPRAAPDTSSHTAPAGRSASARSR